MMSEFITCAQCGEIESKKDIAEHYLEYVKIDGKYYCSNCFDIINLNKESPLEFNINPVSANIYLGKGPNAKNITDMAIRAVMEHYANLCMFEGRPYEVGYKDSCELGMLIYHPWEDDGGD